MTLASMKKFSLYFLDWCQAMANLLILLLRLCPKTLHSQNVDFSLSACKYVQVSISLHWELCLYFCYCTIKRKQLRIEIFQLFDFPALLSSTANQPALSQTEMLVFDFIILLLQFHVHGTRRHEKELRAKITTKQAI